MKLFKFTIVVKDPSTLQKTATKVFENIFEYSFPANGTFFYLGEKPVLSKEVPGNAKTVGHWIPVHNIIDISMESSNNFPTLKARKDYVDSLK